MATGTISLPMPGHLDTTAPPGVVIANNVPYMAFDDTTVEACYWVFRMPANYASGLTAKIQYSMASATSNSVDFEISIMAVSDADSQDLDSDSYDTVNSGSDTVPGTAGHFGEISITMTNADSVAAGDYVRIKLSRDSDDGTNDTATGDCEVRAVTLEYTTS